MSNDVVKFYEKDIKDLIRTKKHMFKIGRASCRERV